MRFNFRKKYLEFYPEGEKTHALKIPAFFQVCAIPDMVIMMNNVLRTTVGTVWLQHLLSVVPSKICKNGGNMIEEETCNSKYSRLCLIRIRSDKGFLLWKSKQSLDSHGYVPQRNLEFEQNHENK